MTLKLSKVTYCNNIVFIQFSLMTLNSLLIKTVNRNNNSNINNTRLYNNSAHKNQNSSGPNNTKHSRNFMQKNHHNNSHSQHQQRGNLYGHQSRNQNQNLPYGSNGRNTNINLNNAQNNNYKKLKINIGKKHIEPDVAIPKKLSSSLGVPGLFVYLAGCPEEKLDASLIKKGYIHSPESVVCCV